MIRCEIVDEWKAVGGVTFAPVAIRNILQTRFGTVPKQVQDSIHKITDLAVLESLVTHATAAVDMRPFRSAIPKTTK